jgi:chemotaxis protein MotA
MIGGIVGLVGAFAVIILGSMADGDPLSSLFSVTASIIVFGGTAAALVTQFGFAHLFGGLKRASWLFKPPNLDLHAFIDQVAEWSTIGRSQGTLALEASLEDVTDPFQKKALQLIVDNTPVEDLHPILANLAAEAGREDLVGGEVWEAAGGYSPTIGVMGAVLGLIHVMMRLDHPEELGAGIATAFVATIYGVGAANLIFLPLGTRLAGMAEALERERAVMIQGFMLLAEGKSGIMIKQILNRLVAEKKAPPPAAEAADEPLGETAEQAA